MGKQIKKLDMDNEIKETDMNNLPKDPVMLLSVVNTNLRDFYSNLDEFCKAKDADKQEIIEKLKMIEYTYCLLYTSPSPRD